MNSILWNLINKYEADINASKFENLVYDSLSLDLFDDLIHDFKEVGISLDSLTVLPRTFSIDADSISSYLREAHFAAWLRKFSQLLDEIFDKYSMPKWDYYRSNISIEFSDE